MNPRIKGWLVFFLLLAGVGLVGLVWQLRRTPQDSVNTYKFNGQRAYRDVEYQVSLGPRIPQSPAHSQVVDWIVSDLEKSGWEREVQEVTALGHSVRNVVGRYGQGEPWIILGAHYDSRIAADRDPQMKNRDQPVPGANDGASGVAVLLELARILPHYLDQSAGQDNGRARQVWLVFFDAEDNGNLPGWDWILGSHAFVASLDGQPDAAVVVDMIGDADLQIYMEKNSDPSLNQALWQAAARSGHSREFIPEYRHSILDDHLPFKAAGIPAADLIDFDYPYWHTTADTADKVSGQSLQAVGDTLLSWLVDEVP